ncbi:MAG: hypothetical protein ACYDAS_03990 [Patescibacteria group bacterium]
MSIKFVYKSLLLLSLFSLFLFVPIKNIKATSIGGIAQNYIALTNGMQTGEIVSLISRNTFAESGFAGVYPSAKANDPNVFGIVDFNSTVTTGITAPNMIPIIQSGTINVYVSNLNGKITKGDLVTSSIVPGVGEKNTNTGMVIGVANASFSKNNILKTETINVKGKKTTISIEKIPVLLSFQEYYNNNALQSQFNGFLPNFIKKGVSFVNIIIAIIIVLMGFVIFLIGTLSSLRQLMGAMIRNPTSKRLAINSAIIVIFILLIIFILTIVMGYAFLVI